MSVVDIFYRLASAAALDIKKCFQVKIGSIIFQTVRVFYVRLLFLSLGCFLIISGMIIIPFSLVFFTEYTQSTKLILGIWVGISYLLFGLAISFVMLSKSKWKNVD